MCVYVCFSQSVSHSRTPPPPITRPSVATQCWLLLHFTWGQSGFARLCARPVLYQSTDPWNRTLEPGKETPPFMEPESSLLCWQVPLFHPVVSQFNPLHTIISCFINVTIIIVLPSMVLSITFAIDSGKILYSKLAFTNTSTFSYSSVNTAIFSYLKIKFKDKILKFCFYSTENTPSPLQRQIG